MSDVRRHAAGHGKARQKSTVTATSAAAGFDSRIIEPLGHAVNSQHDGPARRPDLSESRRLCRVAPPRGAVVIRMTERVPDTFRPWIAERNRRRRLYLRSLVTSKCLIFHTDYTRHAPARDLRIFVDGWKIPIYGSDCAPWMASSRGSARRREMRYNAAWRQRWRGTAAAWAGTRRRRVRRRYPRRTDTDAPAALRRDPAIGTRGRDSLPEGCSIG